MRWRPIIKENSPLGCKSCSPKGRKFGLQYTNRRFVESNGLPAQLPANVRVSRRLSCTFGAVSRRPYPSGTPDVRPLRRRQPSDGTNSRFVAGAPTRQTLKGVLLRSEAEPANTPLVEQARLAQWGGREEGNPVMALMFGAWQLAGANGDTFLSERCVKG